MRSSLALALFSAALFSAALFSVALLLAAALPPDAALAEEAPPDEVAAETAQDGVEEDAAEEKPPTLGQVLAGVILGLLLVAGAGSLVGLLRVIFPGPTRAADAAVGALGTGRLLLTGVLPIVGAGLLGVAAEATGSEAVQVVWAIVVGLPALVLITVGGLAAIPHLGGQLIARSADRERSVLAKCVAGTLVLVLALGVLGWAAKPIAPVLGILVAAWFLGAGLGTIFRPRPFPEDGIGA